MPRVIGSGNSDEIGVFGESQEATGVEGRGHQEIGVADTSEQVAGVHGRGPTGGFFEGGSDAGVHAVNLGNGLAGRFKGDVEVTGGIRLLNADCAKDFDIANTGAHASTAY